MTNLIMVMLVCFGAVGLLVLGVGLAVRDLLARRRGLLDRRLGLETGGTIESTDLLLKVPHGRIDRAFANLIEQSGTTIDHHTALTIVAGLTVVGCAAPLLLLENLLAAAGGLLVGFAAPILWWSIRRARRRAKLRKALPETLELLADGFRAGHNLEQAAEMVSRQALAPVKEEFAYCVSQLRLGHKPMAVLERMQQRIPFPEFKVFATAMLVHRHTGGNLSVLGERLANSARDRQQFQGHLSAVTAGSKLSAFGLVAGTAVAVALLCWIEPDYLQMFVSHELGVPLLAVAACLQMVGIFWVWRVLKVNY